MASQVLILYKLYNYNVFYFYIYIFLVVQPPPPLLVVLPPKKIFVCAFPNRLINFNINIISMIKAKCLIAWSAGVAGPLLVPQSHGRRPGVHRL